MKRDLSGPIDGALCTGNALEAEKFKISGIDGVHLFDTLWHAQNIRFNGYQFSLFFLQKGTKSQVKSNGIFIDLGIAVLSFLTTNSKN